LEFPPAYRPFEFFFSFMCAFGFVALSAITVSGCSPASKARGPMESAQVAAARVAPSKSTLSREHTVVVDVPEAELAGGFRAVENRCTSDSEHHCTILESDLSTGDAPSGLIRLRVDPAAVEDLASFAASQGKLARRSTNVEDLADAIGDTQARIEMLTSYRQQLIALQGKAGTNVDAAIKIASELSTVQTNLERAAGEAAYQAKRVTTDIVRIEFVVAERKAFWRPVREAGRDFLGNLSNGTSQAITAVAYIVPWLFVVVPGLYLLRFLWRRRGR
jgi:hypothetical protein